MGHQADVAIIGGGIAGLSAALSLGRLGRSVVLFSDGVPGGELVRINKIDGIPGTEEPVAGYDLCPIALEQAEAVGTHIIDSAVEGISNQEDSWAIAAGGETHSSSAVILATGAAINDPDIPGAKAFFGKGVSECASCDAPLLRGKTAIVVGGGDSAMQEALELAEHLDQITLLTQGDELTGQAAYVDAVKAEAKIEPRFGSEAVEVVGDTGVTHLRIRDLAGKEENALATDAVFFFTGLSPNSALANGLTACDADGCVVVDAAMRTSVKGLCAIGNLRSGTPHRAAAAMGDAATAAAALDTYLTDGSWA